LYYILLNLFFNDKKNFMARTKEINLTTFIPTWHVYNVKFVCGIQRNKITESCGSVASSAVLSQGIYSTEVNIFNYHHRIEARIFKFFAPIVIENRPVAFEPKQQPAKPIAKIVLRPNSATADDCCGIENLLQVKNLLNIGFLKIVSNVDLSVTAVYTVADLDNRVASIDVEQINGKTVPFFDFG
jgi:hypothetical protein